MKISHQSEGQRMRVHLHGEVLGANCDCLEHFWDRHVDDDLTEFSLDLSGVTRVDLSAKASLSKLLGRQKARGAAISLHDPARLLDGFDRPVNS